MPNVYFLQGDPVTDEQMAQKTSIQGALYLSNDVSGNSNSNRLYIGRTNTAGGIKPIVTPTPFKQIIQFNGATKSSFDGTADVTTNIQAVSLVSSTNNALARFDGTKGFIKNSTVTLDDNGNINTLGDITAQTFIGSLNGNADSASRLTTSAGSTTQPIYFKNGVPVASTATVGGNLKPTYLKAGVITEVANTMAALEVDQTFSGTNTFSKQITASGGITVLGKASIDTNGYVTGTWLRTTASTRTTAAATEICIKRDGWIYTRTPSEILADMGVTASATELNILDGATITINGNTITGNLNGNAASATNATNSSKLYVNTTSADTNYYILGATGTGNQSVYRALNSSGTANTTGVYFNGVTGVLFGAAWNDYAEFRQSNELEAGRVVCETGKGDLILSTERLQPGAEIISDTFGFAIGETNKCKTPIAASGRVLAYTFEDRYEFKAGDAVCAAPGGTVSKMTRDEIINYPDRIIGTVSEIPEYDTWGQNNIKVNNRIWIRIR